MNFYFIPVHIILLGNHNLFMTLPPTRPYPIMNHVLFGSFSIITKDMDINSPPAPNTEIIHSVRL